MRFFNRPRFVDRARYDRAIETVTRALRREPGLASIYQLGGVSAPGISDIDILGVFEDDARGGGDPRDALDETGRYLFTHGVFAISRSLLPGALKYGAFEGLMLLEGENLDLRADGTADEHAAIRRQTALEFLLMNYVTRVVDTAYGISSLRNVLLSTHALRLDLGLLGRAATPLDPYLAAIADWRQRWFDSPVDDAAIEEWWRGFVPALGETLRAEVDAAPLALPARGEVRIARHLVIRADHALAVARGGLRIPPALAVSSRRYVRLQNRLSRFTVTVPGVAVETDSTLGRRFACFGRMKVEWQEKFPRFTPLLNNFTLKVA